MDEAAFVKLLKPDAENVPFAYQSQPIFDSLFNGTLPDWLKLPRDFSYARNWPFVLLLDGYAIASQLTNPWLKTAEKVGEDGIERAAAVYDPMNFRLDGGGSLPSALELWTALHYYQRMDKWNEWMPEGSEAVADRLCRMLRAALVAVFLSACARFAKGGRLWRRSHFIAR